MPDSIKLARFYVLSLRNKRKLSTFAPIFETDRALDRKLRRIFFDVLTEGNLAFKAYTGGKKIALSL